MKLSNKHEFHSIKILVKLHKNALFVPIPLNYFSYPRKRLNVNTAILNIKCATSNVYSIHQFQFIQTVLQTLHQSVNCPIFFNEIAKELSKLHKLRLKYDIILRHFFQETFER